MRAEAADGAFLDGDQHLVLARRAGRISSRVERLGEARVGDGGRTARARRARRRPSALRRAACRATGCATREPSRTMRPLPIAQRLAALGQLDADALAARIAEGDRAGRRWRRRSPPCAPARPRRPAPSPPCPAGSRDRRCRSAGMGRRRRRRPARRGRWRSAPAGSGSPRRAPPGRRRAAGRSNRSRRTASALGGEAGGEGHGVLLGDADVEACAPGKRLAKQVEARCPTAWPR